MVSAKDRWGDLLEDEDELPQSTTTGPDAKGLVTKVEYSRNDRGEVMKRTTKTRVVKIEKKVYESAVARRARWAKFGDAAHERSTDSVTSRSNEEVMLERLRPQKQTQEDKGKVDFQSAMAGGSSNSMIVGSLKDMLAKRRMERQLLAAKGLIAAPERPPGDDDVPSRAGPTPGTWVGASMRNRLAGDPGMDMKRRDENSVRITNLAEDVEEDDLRVLCSPFGQVQRIFVARDRETGESRGFAFVNYMHREDAVRAIANLNGYGYDNLILSVEWATPREPR